MGSGSGASGKLKIPTTGFFLRLVSNTVLEVKAQRDRNRITYAQKAMMRIGMSLNLNGIWEEKKFSSELQAIIAKRRVHFDGQVVQ